MSVSPRTMRAAIALLLATGGAFGVLACSEEERAPLGSVDDLDMPPSIAAQLLAERGCTNCHDGGAVTFLPPVGGPSFHGIAERTAFAWLDEFLRDPSAERRRCPDDLHGLNSGDRAETVTDLEHYFRSVSGSTTRVANPGLWNPEAGEQIFNRVGCLACHSQELGLRELPARWNLPALTQFLLDPLVSRPHDLMPSSELAPQEAAWVASYLLRNQAPRIDRTMESGLKISVYEFPTQPANLAAFEGLEPAQRLISTDISVAHRSQEESFGLIFEGFLEVKEGGKYVAYTTSDDGSRMWIDGVLWVDNDGLHAPQQRRGNGELQHGLHTLRIEMFEAGGGEALSAGWIVQGEEQPFTPEELFHGTMTLPPTGWENFEVDEERASRGRQAASSCLACHRAPGVAAAPVVPWQQADRGCLSETPPADAPLYALDNVDRNMLRGSVRAVLTDGGSWPTPDAEERAVETLDFLGCVNCHQHRLAGGPARAMLAYFTGSEDLGDEGARPPGLTGVGAKLTSLQLKKVLSGESHERPYMHTRMPVYAPQFVAGLASDLVESDAGVWGDAVPGGLTAAGNLPTSDELIEAGRTLAGTGGFACVSCHTVVGHRSPGLQGMDLAVMGRRLTPEWFRRWLMDPTSMRPGTRMPGFFPDGKSVQTEVLGGDAELQILALWTYLSLGEGMPLPEGVVIDADAFELVPVDRPLYVGVFFEGLSARTTAVGFPERVSGAFDLHNVRLGMVWSGDFLDVAGTWNGRAGELETPPVPWDQVRPLPHGPAFARLASPDAKWPTATGKEAGWRMRSHRRDADGRPTWVYAQGNLVVEESLIPRFSADGAHLTRRFRVTNPGAASATMRAWGQSYFVEQEGGGWLAEGRLFIQVHGAEARILSRMPPDHDLLVDIPAGAVDFEFEVEMAW